MKRPSYKIKHDFLFDREDDVIKIPHLDSNLSEKCELRLSNVLNAKDETSFLKLIDANIPNVIIIDDIGKCDNPASERYKQFIIRCICRKLIKHNITAYF